ncbi:MAG: RNA polymerase sporulation sigma factor SigF [Tissierellia bacterium]|nr:RNA polymerase sporulation sigma factor SigF [Tissierellia bacterium]
MAKGNRDTELLTHEETMELIKKAQKGNMEAKEKLVKHNIGLIKSVLRGFTNRGYEIEDLFQIGSIGLLKAIEKFDPSYEVKFSTYAVPMIAGEIKRFLRDDGIIKVSRSLKQTANRIKQAQEKLSKKLGREPTIQEISNELDIDREEIVMALEASYHPDYLYDIVHEKEGNPLYLIDKVGLEEDNEKDILDRIVLQELLSQLKERDRQVIFLRYFKDKTQMEVADILGISQVQVSRIEKRIIREMKKKLAKA